MGQVDQREGDDAADPARLLFAEQGFGYAARQGALKWIEVDDAYPHQPAPPAGECYDLDADPQERDNLAREDAPHPCSDLAAAGRAWRAQERVEGETLDLGEEMESQLRALGYTP